MRLSAILFKGVGLEQRIEMLSLVLRRLYKRKAAVNIRSVFSKTHAVDIAAALEKFSLLDSLALLKMEPSTDRQAQIFSYLSEDVQSDFVLEVSDDFLAHILIHMDSDDAAKILRMLDEDKSSHILEKMKESDSDPMAELLVYPEGTAGYLMNTSVFCLEKDDTVGKAVQVLRGDAEGLEAFYLYVVDAQNRLLGVLSLKQLLLSKENRPIGELMNTAVISVSVSEASERVTRLVEKYDFLSIPVVAENQTLVGVITVDDVLDLIREEAHDEILAMGGTNSSSFIEQASTRIKWVLLAAFFGGISSFIFFLSGRSYLKLDMSSAWIKLSMLPVLLTTVSVMGTQVFALSTAALKDYSASFKKYFSYYLKREIYISLMLCSLGFIIASLLSLVLDDISYVWFFGLSFSFMCWLIFLLSALLPYVFRNWIPRTLNQANLASIMILDIFLFLIFFEMIKG